MKNWTQIKTSCKTENLEEVSAVVSMFDNNLMIKDTSDLDQLDTVYGELIDEKLMNADKKNAAVSFYVPEERNAREIAALLGDRLKALGISCKIDLVGMNESDWTETWKKYYKPLKLSERVTVVPVWEEEYKIAENEITILMDPGMAFGSVTHETTRLCAGMIEKYMKPGDYVLDVGTGSGILAIMASKLGAGWVNCYDIDSVACRVAGENIRNNGCENVTCGVSDLLNDADLSRGQYDFISANIVADIIIRMAGDVGKYVKPNGLLAVSGIIDRQAAEVRDALTGNGFVIEDTSVENDWNSLLLRRI